jgi:hypothetical protein
MNDEIYNKKITVYISENQARGIKTLPRDFNLSGRMREALEEIIKKGAWDCKDYIFTEEEKEFVNKDFDKIKSNAIITLSPAATYQRINISGIKLTLKDASNNEISDDTIIILCKKDKTLGHSKVVARYDYGDLKRKVMLQTKTPLSYYEEIRVYVKDKYIGKGIHPEKIRFYADLCEMKQ